MHASRAIAIAALFLAPMALSGCNQGGLAGGLRAAGAGDAPDEFMVLPTRPLEMPQNLTALPPPLPGTPNRVDYQPHAEAIAGLTGRSAPAGTANGAALVARVGPSDPRIRAELAAEDVTWRETHHGLLLQRLLTKDKNALIYQPMVLNAPAEYDRLLGMGVRVPAAPPRAINQ